MITLNFGVSIEVIFFRMLSVLSDIKLVGQFGYIMTLQYFVRTFIFLAITTIT